MNESTPPAQTSASRESIALIIKGLSDISRRVIVADLPAFVMELQDKAVELRKIAETALSELAGGEEKGPKCMDCGDEITRQEDPSRMGVPAQTLRGRSLCLNCMAKRGKNTDELEALRDQLATLTRERDELKERLDNAEMTRNFDRKTATGVASEMEAKTKTLTRELEELKKCLEPGTAPAIVWGIFQEAERLGFYKPTYKHALTQFVEQVEKLTAENLALRGQVDYLAQLITNVPDVQVYWNDDPDAEDADGLMPLGFTIRSESSCASLVKFSAATLPEAIDGFRAAASTQTGEE